jgi:hypothetical protein
MRGVIAFGVSCCLLQLVLPADARADESASEAATTPPRPAPLPPLTPTARPFTRHVDIGAAVALVHRVAEGQTDAGESLMRYPSAVGLGLSARVDILRYLRGGLYVVRGSSEADPSFGTLGLPGDPGTMTVTSYSFGLRLSPTLPLGSRARTWLTLGAGWGRLEVGRFDVASLGSSFQVRERVFSFVEFPAGIGTSFDIIENWLSVEFEATAAVHVGQRGTALRNSQAIDTLGRRVPVGPFPSIAASFVQTLGLALVL